MPDKYPIRFVGTVRAVVKQVNAAFQEVWDELTSDPESEVVTDGTVTLSATARAHRLNSTGAGITATLPDPQFDGQEKTLYATSTTGAISVTADSASIREAGNNRSTITFSAIMDRVHLIALDENNWAVVSSHGVTYS